MTIRDLILGRAGGYRAFKAAIGGERIMATISQEYVRSQPGQRLLDIGCGFGDMLEHLPNVEYVGIDLNQAYLDLAQKRSTRAGTFRRVDVTEVAGAGLGQFDVAIAIGLLHHLSDEQAATLLAAVPVLLRPGGRFVSVDPVWHPEQATVGRVMAALDRGRHVRDEAGYERLISLHFAEVNTVVRHDLLAVPYSHCIAQAQVPSA